MSDIVEGPLILDVQDRAVVVRSAPKTARITLSQIQQTDRLRADGNQIVVGGGQVVYQVTGWDPVGSCLIAERCA